MRDAPHAARAACQRLYQRAGRIERRPGKWTEAGEENGECHAVASHSRETFWPPSDQRTAKDWARNRARTAVRGWCVHTVGGFLLGRYPIRRSGATNLLLCNANLAGWADAAVRSG